MSVPNKKDQDSGCFSLNCETYTKLLKYRIHYVVFTWAIYYTLQVNYCIRKGLKIPKI